MKRLAILFLATALITLDTANAQSNRVSLQHSEPLRQLAIGRAAELNNNTRRQASTRMSFDALGRRFDLDLLPNTALLSPAARAAIPASIEVYRGELTGAPSSWVRIVVQDGVPSGLIFDGQELLAIERASEFGGGDEPVIFRLADLRTEPGTMSCGVASTSVNAAALYEEVASELRVARQQGPGAVEEIEIGALGDSDYATLRLNPESDILTRLNNVDGIFSSEIGVQITVPRVDIFDDQSDPFTDTTDSGELIDELAAYRESSATQTMFGLTHLFTGRPLDGTTVGIAFVGSLCSQRFGAGLTEGSNVVTIDSLVAAHEIGHNFGADHDGDPMGSCPNEPGDQFIMASQSNGSMTFSDCSKQIMTVEAAAASCVTPLPATDVTVSSVGQPTTAFIGNAITLNFAIDNRGSLEAQNVAVDVSLPNNVTLNSAASTQAACTSGAGSVNCTIGTLAGGAGDTVTLSASADAVGPAGFNAVVSADVDDNTNNNSIVHTVTIEPAVDLAVDTPPSVQATVGTTRNVALTLRNSSVMDATNVTAVITVDAGLRADSVSWSAGSCTISATQIDCSAATIAAQSTSTLAMNLSAVTTGNQGYTVTLDSTEQDADASDNVVSGTVNVVSASNNNNNDDDDGGGSLGYAGLLALAVALLRRRYRLVGYSG